MKRVAVGVAAPARPPRINNVVAGILAVTAFLYFAAVFNVIVPHYSWSVPGMLNFWALSATTGIGLYCYLLCVFVDPGRVPPGWEPPDPEQAAAAATVVQVKRSGRRRHCTKCEAPKPPRCHHCRRCGRCVLRMDHHCVWVNGCIGHANYRAFLLMIPHLTAAAAHALALLLALNAALMQLALGVDEGSKAAAAATGGAAALSLGGGGAGGGGGAHVTLWRRVGWKGPVWVHVSVQVVASALALPIVCGLLLLLLWNAYLCAHNKTTIEHHEGVNAQLPGGGAAGSRRASAHPFDLGSWFSNAASVCGEDVLLWPLPVRAAAEGDGLHFATAYGGRAAA